MGRSVPLVHRIMGMASMGIIRRSMGYQGMGHNMGMEACSFKLMGHKLGMGRGSTMVGTMGRNMVGIMGRNMVGTMGRMARKVAQGSHSLVDRLCICYGPKGIRLVF